MGNARRGRTEWQQRSMRISSIVKEKRGVTSGRVDFVVDRKFSASQPFSPVMLVFTTEYLEVLLHFLIHMLSLAICLRVTGGGKVFRDPEERVKGAGERGDELGTAIRNDTRGKAEVFPNVVAVLFGGHFRCNGFMAWDKASHF